MDYLTKDENTKFCKHCGYIIMKESVVCIHCGCQVEELKGNAQPQVVINNSNNNSNVNTNHNINGNTNVRVPYGIRKNKWVALILCFILGMFGAHKFYEGKMGMGILYLFTAGLFGIGWIVDLIVIISKPNYYLP